MISFDTTERVVAYGAGEVLVEAVETARELGFPTAVVTAPRQSDCEIDGEPMIDLLQSRDVEIVVTDDVNQNTRVNELVDTHTVGLSFGAAWIFDESIIDAHDGKLVNFHGSRLPQDRGGGGFSWRILRDDPMGYSQAHLITSGIDTGDILITDEYQFPKSCTTPAEYAAYANKQETEIVTELLEGIADKREFETTSQPEYLSSYWPRLSTEEHGYIDWEWSLEEIVQFIQAFSDPYEGAKTFVNGTEIYLKQCESFHGDGTFHPFQTGILYRKDDQRGYISTPEGSLIVESVVDENGRDMLHDIALGDRFYTPTERLEQARKTRVYFTPTGMRREEY
jgi:methionyl-tRNA formyltransferase